MDEICASLMHLAGILTQSAATNDAAVSALFLAAVQAPDDRPLLGYVQRVACDAANLYRAAPDAAGGPVVAQQMRVAAQTAPLLPRKSQFPALLLGIFGRVAEFGAACDTMRVVLEQMLPPDIADGALQICVPPNVDRRLLLHHVRTDLHAHEAAVLYATLVSTRPETPDADLLRAAADACTARGLQDFPGRFRATLDHT
jgi:hypothetical protein